MKPLIYGRSRFDGKGLDDDMVSHSVVEEITLWAAYCVGL